MYSFVQDKLSKKTAEILASHYKDLAYNAFSIIDKLVSKETIYIANNNIIVPHASINNILCNQIYSVIYDIDELILRELNE